MTAIRLRNTLWLRSLVIAFVPALVLESIRATNGIRTGQFGTSADAVAVVGPLLVVIGILGVVMSWSHYRAGYIIVLVLSTVLALAGFGLLPGNIGALPIKTIGETSGTFFVWVVLWLRAASTLSMIFSVLCLVDSSQFHMTKIAKPAL